MEIDEVLALSDDLARAWSYPLYIGMKPGNLGHAFASDEDKTAKTKEMREKFLAEEMPKFMGFYTKALEKSGGPFFCGQKVTIADLQILPQLRYYSRGVADFVPANTLEPFPVVTAWIARMLEVPQIKAWYASKQ
ncbi:unnamed protein product [Polarella glacialis]|uniref:GST C-terminal domain-containing protein n=1 Tax=Polarella glacialis TaxID=89957 RepID=A0A813IRQ0_POLGL|nr:unnamed protein product [Polarella glacialis]CAE8639843.1 unnamed protein product [Polarella glacialis]CAE8655982.1 unnamed protein product [Polarella glacialis]